VLIELLVHFPVYRTYADARGRSREDAAIMLRVVAEAQRTCRPGERALVELIDRWLGGEAPQHAPGATAVRLRLRALARFQQLTSPVAAKSVEDTAFYRHGRLLSRNEVGANPSQFTLSADAFHQLCGERLRRYPLAMLATATHDHKHGEDVRARLAVLSERAEEWAALVRRWIERSAPLRSDDAPSKGDVAMLLQVIVGAWPLDLDWQDGAGRTAFAERLAGWQQKALREAKLESDWAAVNEPYEAAAQRFLKALLADAEKPELLEEIAGFVDAVAAAGAVNGLAQLLLKLTVPGVPDIYQGTEHWDFSLVDPDNRRPVDYGMRAATLGRAPIGALAASWRDGRVKQAILAQTLDLRRRNEEVFNAGTYEPVSAEGPMADRVMAFMRRLGDRMLLTVAPRLPTDLMGDAGTIALDARSWKNTVLRLRPPSQGLIDVFGGAAVDVPAGGLPLAAVCGAVPVGLVCSVDMIRTNASLARNATS